MREMNNFTSTSDEPYDRHRYKIVSKHYCYNDCRILGRSSREWWWNNCHLPTFDAVVHVIDKPKTKKKSKGFA